MLMGTGWTAFLWGIAGGRGVTGGACGAPPEDLQQPLEESKEDIDGVAHEKGDSEGRKRDALGREVVEQADDQSSDARDQQPGDMAVAGDNRLVLDLVLERAQQVGARPAQRLKDGP